MTAADSHWHLYTDHISLLIARLPGHLPQLVWLGARLDVEVATCADVGLQMQGPVPRATLDEFQPLTLFPEASTGYLGQPALDAHRDGAGFAHRMRLDRVQQRQDGTALALECKDEIAGIRITQHIELDRSGVASFSTELTYEGAGTLQVDWLASATLPLAANAEMLTLHGRWGLEAQAQRQRVTSGRIQVENRTGRTSHDHFPGCIVGAPGFNETSGELLGMQLAWSGNHRLIAEQLADGSGYFQAGALLLPGEIRLQAGESFSTPVLHVAASEGMHAMSQRFHHYAREQVLPAWTRTPRPVHANSWEALYFNHDSDALKALISAAAAAGAERFVLDDGWFRHRRDDSAGLGDWFVDAGVYPQGLQPIVEHVRSHGLQFGLWFEPEMVNPDSDLYRAHPDWALQLDQYHTPTARNQYVLDIARAEVQDYLFDCMSNLISKYAIDYIKWDMNRNLVLPGDGRVAKALAQPLACYQLMQRLVDAFPALEIESCSSGGARIDLGVLRYTGRVWSSDNIDPLDRVSIQRNLSLFFPPEVLGAHVGSDVAHLTGRHTDLHTRAIVALQGQFGYEFDARQLDQAASSQLQHYTRLYRDNRHWLAQSTCCRLEHLPHGITALGQLAIDGSRSWWSVVATGSTTINQGGRLRLRELDPSAQYQVQMASDNLSAIAAFALALPPWLETGITATGASLMSIGLPLPVLPPHSAILLSCCDTTKSDS